MANNFLVVPIIIRGLILDNDQMVSSPLADFSKLPWNDGTRDINFDQPFVADGIIHQPFGSQNLLLKAGVHLHFIVPHYLGQHVPNNSGLSNSGLSNSGRLPAAPNRWLITNRTDNSQWLVESDYVHDVSYNPSDPGKHDEPTCIIPFNSGQPYRYMGRKTLLTAGRPVGDTFKSLNNGNPLTVSGYGDINFSSFYPNCMGVFGFHDGSSKTPSSNLKYSIIGWNADAEDDLLSNAIVSIFKNSGNASIDQINSQLKNLFKVEINLNNGAMTSSSVPRTLFYGEITIDSAPSQQPVQDLEIAVGNTGTEALSALLADRLSPSDSTQKTVIEEQLEAILMFSKLDHLLVDTGPKFLEARHEKGFRSSHSGHIWRIISQTTDTVSADAQALPELPSDLAGLLHQLNLAQSAYDKCSHEITSLREQLYLDWYKYMHAAYPPLEGRGQFPDPDHIRYFIETSSFAELNSLIASTGQVTYGDVKASYQPAAQTTVPTDLANQLYSAWNAAKALLDSENDTRQKNNQPQLSLSMVAGPRYWEPNAPVILISGLPGEEDAPAAPEDSYLQPVLYSSSQALDTNSISTQNSGDILIQCSGTNACKLSEQTWAPFLLDWEADLTDVSLFDQDGGFTPSSLQNSFDLDQFGPDFNTDKYRNGNLSVFSGSVIMSQHAGPAMLRNLELFITNALKRANISFTSGKSIDDFLKAAQWADAFGMLSVPSSVMAVTSAADCSDPLYTAWAAYNKLIGMNVISQTLNGFNQACIMRRKAAQLPISEPLGFAEAQAFTANVKALVQNSRDTSPITAFDFNPIRSGQLKLNRLRLTDDFGISTDIDLQIIAAETLLDDVRENIFLRPRLAQPARLNFRWLSATPVSDDENNYEDISDTAETNDHPDTSPVCGWLMANYIDNFISVYAADGTALGYIDASANWNVLPWSNTVANVNANIQNPYLLNAVLWIMNTKINDFLTATQTALNNIAPANAHLFDAKAILMGRPMAVVRSRVSFQTKGIPVLEQSWPALLNDINNCDIRSPYTYSDRHNKGWTAVQLPVRLGEHHQLNDGLVGYWPEDDQGNLSTKFIAPETSSDDVTDSQIDTFTGSNYKTQWLSLDDAPANITMLVDPRGLVHATTGILPTKAISIPPQHYLPALKKINMWFNSSPILQPVADIEKGLVCNLPAINGFVWQWWDPFDGVLPVNADDPKSNMHGSFQLMDGWLALSPQGNDLNIEVKQTDFEAAATNSLHFFISPLGPQAVAQTYVTQNRSVISQLLQTSNTQANGCAQIIGGFQGTNTTVQFQAYYIVSYPPNNTTYSEVAMNINDPFSAGKWLNCYNNISNNFLDVYSNGQQIPYYLSECVAGISSGFNPVSPWTDLDFTNYVTQNFTELCNNLLTYTSANIQLLTDNTGSYIVPCRALYDYFYVMYQRSKYLNPDGTLAFMLNVSKGFGAQIWMDCFNQANQLLPQPNYLLASADGIISDYNIQNPWEDDDFANYVSKNFITLCTNIPSVNLINFDNNNYIVPSQSLYDYFWANYQNSITGNS